MIRSTMKRAAGKMEKEIMNRPRFVSQNVSEFGLGRKISLGVSIVLLLIWARFSPAQAIKPKTFSSAGAASHALYLAVRNEDEQAVGAILGVGKEITSSSDEIEDKLERERFGQKYQEMHRLVRESDGKTMLYIGAENWPFPIPLVSKNGKWHFDSDAGTQEVLFRRVGENETKAVDVCRAFAAARKHEMQAIGDDEINQYAQGLVTVGPPDPKKDASPFHGYYFRIASEETPDVVLVAFPAEYRQSGVMSFILTQGGVVYQKDLGADTPRLAPAVLKEHNAKSKWDVVK